MKSALWASGCVALRATALYALFALWAKSAPEQRAWIKLNVGFAHTQQGQAQPPLHPNRF
ncbi:MAG: hypothetical protein HQL54_08675 [Magnetococcales bacterium]|nr:hypothetical protein [Magnetococcales bacterium]